MRSLLVFILVVVAVASIGGLVGIDQWYATLTKPAWNPPGWVFGPVWGILYLAMAIAGWRLWQAQPGPTRSVSLSLWSIQLILNALWTPLFFGLHQPLWALIDLLVLVAVVAASFGWFRHASPLAAWLFAPYLAWILFATALNVTIVILN